MAALLMGNARADSLWSSEFKISIVADKRASTVGDIITVVVQESSSTKKDSSTQTAKKSQLDAGVSSFLFSPASSGLLTKGGKLPAMAMNSNNTFDGGGKINNSASILARFGVRIVDVLPNGNLIVEGTRNTTFSQESQTVVLRGTVRQYDVTPENTVFSYNLADVSIKFVDSGAVSNSQHKGWFSRVFDVLSPF
jgi:flagellar L-ring protein precursor FlgH